MEVERKKKNETVLVVLKKKKTHELKITATRTLTKYRKIIIMIEIIFFWFSS